MKRLQSLDSICKGLGGQCITFDPSKKWTLDEAKAFVKAHWVDGMGGGLTVFKFQDGGSLDTTIIFGYFDVDPDSVFETSDDIVVPITGDYVVYDDYNGDLRVCTDDGTANYINIHLLTSGGAYLA